MRCHSNWENPERAWPRLLNPNWAEVNGLLLYMQSCEFTGGERGRRLEDSVKRAKGSWQ